MDGCQIHGSPWATDLAGLEDLPTQPRCRDCVRRPIRRADHLVQAVDGLVILSNLRRKLVRIGVTTNPTAEWIAGQLTEAFPWDEAPQHLIRDRDSSFGPTHTQS